MDMLAPFGRPQGGGPGQASVPAIHMTIISVTELLHPENFAETPLFVRMSHGTNEYTTTERFLHDEHGALWEEDFEIAVDVSYDTLNLDVVCVMNGVERVIGGVPLPLEQIMPEEQELMSGVFDANNEHAGVLRILTSWPDAGVADQPNSNAGGAACDAPNGVMSGIAPGGGFGGAGGADAADEPARVFLLARALRRHLCDKVAWRALGRWRRATLEARFAAERVEVAGAVREVAARMKDAIAGDYDEGGADGGAAASAPPPLPLGHGVSTVQLRSEVAALMVEFAQLEARAAVSLCSLLSARSLVRRPSVGVSDSAPPSPRARTVTPRPRITDTNSPLSR